MSITIPKPGAQFNDVNIARCTWGDTTKDVQFTDTTLTPTLFDIQAEAGGGKIFVHRITTIVTALSTSLDATIGDTDVDGFFTSTTWNPAAAGNFINNDGAYLYGRLYSSSDAIKATLTAADTGDGAGEFYLFYSIVSS